MGERSFLSRQILREADGSMERRRTQEVEEGGPHQICHETLRTLFALREQIHLPVHATALDALVGLWCTGSFGVTGELVRFN